MFLISYSVNKLMNNYCIIKTKYVEGCIIIIGSSINYLVKLNKFKSFV